MCIFKVIKFKFLGVNHLRGRCLSKRRRQADGWTPRNPVSRGTKSKPYKNEIFGHFFFHPLFFLMRDLRCFSDLKYTLMGSLNRLLSCPAKDNNGAARKSSSDFCKTVDIYYTLEWMKEMKGWRKRVKGLVQTASYVILREIFFCRCHANAFVFIRW